MVTRSHSLRTLNEDYRNVLTRSQHKGFKSVRDRAVITTCSQLHTTDVYHLPDSCEIMEPVQKVDFKESLPTGRIKKSVSTWVECIQTPTLKSARIFKSNSNGYQVWSEWSQDDLATKKSSRFSKCYNVFAPPGAGMEAVLASPSTYVMETPTTPGLQSKFICYSPSGQRRAVLNEIGSGTETYEVLQIWNSNSLEKSYDLKELDLHKTVYSPGVWGTTVAWSPDESRLMYLAEKKIPKAEPFYSSSARRKLNEDCDPENISRGQEYAFRQGWGEQLDSCVQAVIVVLDPVTDGFKQFALPNNDFPYDLQWVGNSSIVGVAITHKWWKLGLIYCTNRESRIFQIDPEGFRYLSDPQRAAMSPRVTPTGDCVLWQDREIIGPHNSSRQVLHRRVYPLSTDSNYKDDDKPKAVVALSSLDDVIPPVWDDFPVKCFTSGGDQLYFLTTCDCRTRLLRIQKREDNFYLQSLSGAPDDLGAILDILEGFLLVQGSSSITTQYLHILQYEPATWSRIPLQMSASILQPPPQLSFCKVAADESTPPSILVLPSTEEAKVPLVVVPHGGPHSTFTDSFDLETMHFVKLGFAVLKVNYIGSTGSQVDSTKTLTGYISELDVPQIQKIVEGCIQETSKLDSNNVFLCGGSHGGFVTAHLTSKYPGFYKAAVLRNPVIDLNIMIGTSDITDWVYVESGLPFNGEDSLVPAISTDGNYEKMSLYSPITLAKDVVCPTLLHLGTKDLRVPMSQGFSYYRALKYFGKDVEVHVYDDNHALYTTPVRANARVQIVRFLNKFADPPVFEE